MTISTAVCNTATVAAKPLTGGDTHRHGQLKRHSKTCRTEETGRMRVAS